jgi:hypothetical protein
VLARREDAVERLYAPEPAAHTVVIDSGARRASE